MENIKRQLQKTPNAFFCVLGAVLFLLVFYKLAYRTPLGEIWLPTNMDNDEVMYNRQIVSVITHGGPQGYFGYNESHAAIGRFGGWGPFLIWAYALPGFLFGSSVNTVLWCNVFFAVAGMALFVWAVQLRVWQQAVFAAALVCLWMPLSMIFCGSSETLHYALALTVVGASAALARRFSAGWFCVALCACFVETVFRPNAFLFWIFPLLVVWKDKKHRMLCIAAAAASFAFSIFTMVALTAPYFSDGGIDYYGMQQLLEGDIPGAVLYELQRAGNLLYDAWVHNIMPTLGGQPQEIGVGCLVFLVLTLVTVGCLAWDIVHKRPCLFKAGALVCAGGILLALLFLYNIGPRQLMLLCVVMIGALAVENMPQSPVFLPVLMVLLLPLNAKRSSLSTWFPEMAEQMEAVETALTESVQAHAGDDPWDYTLAYAYADDVFHGYLYAVPAGMGIAFDKNTYLADAANPIHSRYAMVNHGTAAEARLIADGWRELISTKDLIIYMCPWGETEK